MSRHDNSNGDGVWREQQQIERLAGQDPVFVRNYMALTRNSKFRQLKPTVTQWLIRSAQARERREAQLHYRDGQRPVVAQSMEQELFGRA